MGWAAQLVMTAALAAGLGFVAGRWHPVPMPAASVSTEPIVPLPPASGITVLPAQQPPQAARPPAVAISGMPALNLLRTVVDTHRGRAQLCLIFNHAVLAPPAQNPADFLRFAPAFKPALQVAGSDVCIGGLAFGTTYDLTIRAGLQGADGARALADETVPLSLGDLEPAADFADDGFILPRDTSAGLPVATVNLSSVHFRIDRITDRVLARTQMGRGYADNQGEYNDRTEAFTDTLGVPVWEGDLAVHGNRNERVVTALPVANLLGQQLPGAYRMTLVRKAHNLFNGEEFEPETVRWIFSTDLMLTTHQGADGLHVFVRSLKSAKPVTGAVVTLLAANNDELARLTTDTDGEAVVAHGLLHGVHGHAPRMVMAYLSDDFTALELNKPAFDFADRGVDGRGDPGPVDGFIYTDRGIYRPGETIDVTTLVRGRLAETLPAGQAIAIILRRPDGVEAGRWRLEPNRVGAATQLIALKPTAPRGTWRLEEVLAGTTPLIGALAIQVQDFVPNRLAVTLTPTVARMRIGVPADIAVDSHYLYGAPAADLAVSAHIQLQRDTSPVPFSGWQFGKAGDDLNAEAQDIDGPHTDAQGKSSLHLDPAKLKIPVTTLPLRADITVAVAEPGGRATESRMTLKLATRPVLLGLKAANPQGEVDEDSEPAVAAAAFTSDGTPIARRLKFRLLEQVTEYHYFRQGRQWQWRTTSFDRPVTFGDIDAPAVETGALIHLPKLSWGSYRLELMDSDGGFTSLILHAGYSASPEAAESPEKVSVTLVGKSPLPGGVATVHVKPPFAGEMLLTVENSRVLAVQSASIPEGGADVTVKAGADWGVGAYVMASVYRPSHTASGHAPLRAVGLAYVPVDAAPRTIDVALKLPAVLRPRTHLDLPVQVSGQAASGPVYVTLAAVDEGILQLTRFASPDPNGHFFGKRRLAVDVRDDYAHLIDGNEASPGEVRSGGDIDGAGLSVVPTKTTALFSGLVQAAADGHAIIPLDLPDFTGGLRLMAVAVSGAGFGHADAQVPVRDAVVAQMSLPRFLAPGDDAQMTLLAHNVEAPAGLYHIHLVSSGALARPAQDVDVPLAARQAVVKTFPLHAGAVGIGQIHLTLTGGGGAPISHDWSMQVRTPYQSTTQATRAVLAPGASLTLTPALTKDFDPATTSVVASLSSVGAIDVPGLLATLDEYPFGCSEQLVSRAMPLLYVPEEAQATLGDAPRELRGRVQDAVDRLLERQDEAGAFGLWRAGDGQAEPYLGGLIVDFLTQARAHGYAVPQAALSLGRHALTDMDAAQWMLHRYWYPAGSDDSGIAAAGRAYALLLAARAGEADLSELRYVHDTELTRLEPISRAQLGVALSIVGDVARAKNAFDTAEAGLRTERDTMESRIADFYRTRIRDTAALIALAAEAGEQTRVTRLLASLEHFDTRPERLTTQEQGWLVLAAGTLLEKSGPVSISLNGAPMPPRAVITVRRAADSLGDGVTLTNTGHGAVYQTVSVRGLPLAAPPAEMNAMTLEKTITDPDGKPVDLAHLRQNMRLVVHLRGRALDVAYHQTMLVDPLPAGFEIERVVPRSMPNNANGLPWLGEISPTRTAEKRDDRFLAAIDLNSAGFAYEANEGESQRHSGAFNVAYTVRVVSPGHFVLPAASIRDMYRADTDARGPVGEITVEGR